MKSIKQRLEENYILGCIKRNNAYQFYLMPIAWWILNHEKYNPDYISNDGQYVFRNNVFNVTDDQLEPFFISISEDEISISEVKNIIENFSEEYSEIMFFIDFDTKEYISAFDDIEVETYLPNETWTGKYENPQDYIPKNILDQIN